MMSSSSVRHYAAGIGILLIVFALAGGIAGCDGNPTQPEEIRTWYDLDDVRDNLGGSYVLVNDLDSTTAGYQELASPTANGGKGWAQIGGAGAYDWFTGAFHGQGYEIRDLFINRPDDRRVGLFGHIWEGGIVEEVGVVNVTVMCSPYAEALMGAGESAMGEVFSPMDVAAGTAIGALVGQNYRGTVRNCYSSGTVVGDDAVGGLVGSNVGTVSDSYSTANVIGYWWYSHGAGGLVGANYGTVTGSSASGDVTGRYWVGGLVGSSGGTDGGTVSTSYATGSVTGDSGVGGLLGSNTGTVSDSYSTGSVTGGNYSGGLVGGQDYEGTVSSSFWNTLASGQSASNGGIGKNTTEMHSIATFSAAGWNIIAVAPNQTNPAYTWNIVNNATYPFLGWQSII